MHLAPGGAYVVRGGAGGVKRLDRLGQESLPALLRRIEDLVTQEAHDDEEESRLTTDDRRLGQAVTDVSRHGRHLVVRNGGSALAKLHERQANIWLKARGKTFGSFVERHPRQHFESRCGLSESTSFRAGGMPSSYHVPAITSREYLGSICLPGQVVLDDNALMPDTYRHNQRTRLQNRFLDDLGPLFAAPRRPVVNPVRLEGTYFHLDSEYRGHFGHALTEQLSRLWGWQEAKATYPDLKVLFAVNARRRTVSQFERDLYAAAGIGESDLVLVDQPVEVERLLAGTPMFANPAYVHPRIVETWSQVGGALVASARDGDYPRRIFCSRRTAASEAAFGPNRRVCRNADVVEALFEAHGFTVVHTEDHSLAEQARLFQEAEVIAGYAGSAMFSLVFAGSPKQVVLISSESYTAKNEHLISSALGHRLAIAWCQAERRHEDRWDPHAFNSAYTFDLEREGRFVTRVLEDL